MSKVVDTALYNTKKTKTTVVEKVQVLNILFPRVPNVYFGRDVDILRTTNFYDSFKMFFSVGNKNYTTRYIYT